VLESGHGLPSRCNDETSPLVGGELSPPTPSHPTSWCLTRAATGSVALSPAHDERRRSPAARPGDRHRVREWLRGRATLRYGLKPGHSAVGAQNNSSRIVTVNPQTGQVTPFIAGLPTGDHPAEQITFKDGWIYWSQGSTTNSGVVGHDNGGGANQQDIPCQDITLSQNTFSSVSTGIGAHTHFTSDIRPTAWLGRARPCRRSTVRPGTASAMELS